MWPTGTVEVAASGAEPPQPATAVGEAVSREDLTWREAAAELAPAKSLARGEDGAKQLFSTVSLVGTLLAGLGLVAGDQLTDPGAGVARGLGMAAAGAAVVAVVLAVGWSLLRISRGVAPGNLVAVRDWYGRQFRRAYLVVAAGVLLLVAVVLAGGAGRLATVRLRCRWMPSSWRASSWSSLSPACRGGPAPWC